MSRGLIANDIPRIAWLMLCVCCSTSSAVGPASSGSGSVVLQRPLFGLDLDWPRYDDIGRFAYTKTLSLLPQKEYAAVGAVLKRQAGFPIICHVARPPDQYVIAFVATGAFEESDLDRLAAFPRARLVDLCAARLPSVKSIESQATSLGYRLGSDNKNGGESVLQKCPALRHVYVRSSSAGMVGGLDGLPGSVESIGFSGDRVDNSWLYALARLKVRPKGLVLDGVDVTAAGIRSVRTPAVTHVSLNALPNSSDLVEAFSEFEGIEELHVTNAKLGIDTYRRVALMRSLKRLILDGTDVDNESAGELLASMPKLNFISVAGTKVTPAFVQDIRRGRPGMVIVDQLPALPEEITGWVSGLEGVWVSYTPKAKYRDSGPGR